MPCIFPEFLPVGDGRHRRPFSRNRFRHNEYDWAIGRHFDPSLTPLLAKNFGWPAAFLMAAGLGVMGSLVWLAVNPERTLLREPAAAPVQRIWSLEHYAEL